MNTATNSIGKHFGRSILVMDDDEFVLSVTAELLEHFGYLATTCANGFNAITLYTAAKELGTPFSAVILDLNIPDGMGGKETARQILAVDSEACLIVSSGNSDDPIMSDFSMFGFSGAVAKPYNIREFGQLMNDALTDLGKKLQ
jgi:CheY-like chemotaxis protein